jgi:capsular exopolysaccharide synthesis family protein
MGNAKLRSVVQKWGPRTMDVLTAGEIPPNPSLLVGSTSMTDLLDYGRAQYDLVIIDAPPLLPVADAAVLARITDGAVVVVDLNRVRTHQLREALATLAAVDARCLGVVANRVRSTKELYYGPVPRLRDRITAAFRGKRPPRAHPGATLAEQVAPTPASYPSDEQS